MPTEDNYNRPNRTIADWIAEGYTKPYATALYNRDNRTQGTNQK
jgi:predicted metalloprotease with PDZ domain